MHRVKLEMSNDRQNNLQELQYDLEKNVKNHCKDNHEDMKKEISNLFDDFKHIPTIVRQMNHNYDTTKAELKKVLEEKLESGLKVMRLDQLEF